MDIGFPRLGTVPESGMMKHKAVGQDTAASVRRVSFRFSRAGDPPRRVRDLSSAGFRIVLEVEVRRVACRTCGTVKRERLDFLANNPHFTRRFAFYVGRRCRQASIRDVAKELKLTWDTVKALEMQDMRARSSAPAHKDPRQLASTRSQSARATTTALWSATWFAGGRSGSVATTARRPVWRSSMPGWDMKSSKIRLIVMDKWKPFRNIAQDEAPEAAILRQVPHHAPSRRGARQGAQRRICAAARQGPALHHNGHNSSCGLTDAARFGFKSGERRRFVMPIPLRADFDATQVRALARTARMRRRCGDCWHWRRSTMARAALRRPGSAALRCRSCATGLSSSTCTALTD